MQNLSRMGVFAVVAELQSISAAADKLGFTKSAVSKQITALEAELGVKLLYRTMRRTRLTDEGATLYRECADILAGYHRVVDMAEQLRETPSGELLLEIPESIATHRVIPQLGRFRQEYPHIHLRLRLRQASLQEVSEDLDVAIVTGELPDSSAVCRRIGEITLGAYASPAYLAAHGTPAHPDQLTAHHCIATENAATPGANQWVFRQGDDVIQMEIPAVITVNDTVAMKQLVENGLGISILPDYAVQDSLKDNRLLPVLTEYQLPSIPVYVIYSERKQVPPKVRAMVDFLVECFARKGYGNGDSPHFHTPF